MFIHLATLSSNFFLSIVIHVARKKLDELKKIPLLKEQSIKTAHFLIDLSVVVACLGWFLKDTNWVTLIASLLALAGTSSFFNGMRQWFKKTQHLRIRREDLVSVGLWLMWLLSVSVFLANILVIVLY